MKMRKLIAVALSTVLAATSIMTAVAADLDCTGWWTAWTEGYEVDAEEGLELSFTSTTYATANSNWNTADVVVYTGDEAVVGGAGYDEYYLIRSDAYGWGDVELATAMTIQSDVWGAWLSQNKAGAECSVTAEIVDSNVEVTFNNSGLITKTVTPVDTTKEVYISLTGELCTVTDVVVNGTPVDADIDCTGWWTAWTEGFAVGDGLEITFTGTTYATANSNWNTPDVVVYTGDEAVVGGTGYDEYYLIRSDAFGWGKTELATSMTVVSDVWGAWLAQNHAGAECTVSAEIVDSNVEVTFNNAGLISKTVVPVDTTKPVYISLTGELCTLTDIYEVVTDIDTTFAQKSEDGADLRIITEFSADLYNDGDVSAIEAMGVKISKNGGAEVDFVTEYVTANTNLGISGSESAYAGAFASIITNYDATATYEVTPYYTIGGVTVIGETVTIDSTVIG